MVYENFMRPMQRKLILRKKAPKQFHKNSAMNVNPIHYSLRGGLEVLQHVRCMRGHSGIVRTVVREARLDEHLLDHAVVDDGRVSPGAFTEAPLRGPVAVETHGAREGTGTVGNQLDLLEVARVERIG